jgi:hypothetical protein
MVWRIARATGPIFSAEDLSKSPVEIRGISQRLDKIRPKVLRPLPGEPSKTIPFISLVEREQRPKHKSPSDISTSRPYALWAFPVFWAALGPLLSCADTDALGPPALEFVARTQALLGVPLRAID